MTTGTNPDVTGARRWAAGLLGVQENASPAEARRAYFRKLRECEFLPPRSLHHALHVLEGKRAPAEIDEEWLLEEEGRLRADVESFAEKFFSLPVTQRRQHWDALLSRCPSVSPRSARLQGLKAGLDVEIQSLPLGLSFHGRLAKHLLQSFPLSPLGLATSRQAFLREIEDSSAAADHRFWEKAARYLLAEWPTLAALDRELVQHIAKLRSRLKRRTKMHRRSQRQRRAAPAGSGKESRWWLLLVLLGVLSGVLGGMTKSNKSTSSRTPSLGYHAPSEGKGHWGIDGVNLRMVTDPKTGARSVQAVPGNIPPLHELFDPSKFDVEVVDPAGFRVLRFTPRPDSTITGSNGPQAKNGEPLLFGEATLRLLGVSQDTINGLISRTAVGKRPDNSPKPPPGELGPRPPKSSQGDKTRP